MIAIYKRGIYFTILVLLVPIILLGCVKISYKNNNDEIIMPKGVEAITEITPTEVIIDEYTWIGVDMATINYASDEKIVFHGSFGLFVYDLNEEKIIRAIDVKSIGCNYTTGDKKCIVTVSKDGKKVRLHPENSEDMYIYNIEENTLIKAKYENLNDEFNTLPIDETYPTKDEEYIYSYIKLKDEEVSYLRVTKSNRAIDLEYVKNDKVYSIFK